MINLLMPATLYDSNLNNVELSGVTNLVSKVIDFFSFGGLIAVGILLFTLILKVIPLPLDIYSRVATKKNALKMEKMRPELEKLQKQYANNKELYNQKMMALYKKQGYSQLAACLPTIFTLVFFIIVITAFQQYSTFCKIDTFNQMAISYSNSIRYNDDITLKYYNEDGVTFDAILTTEDEKREFLSREDINPYSDRIIYVYDGSEQEYNENIKKPAQKAAAETYKELSKKSSFLWVKNIWIEDLPWKKAFIDKEVYMNNTFSYSQGCSQKKFESSIHDENAYNDIFGDEYIQNEMKKPNGYLILVVISIGTMLVSQLLMTKSQKTQMELQSVDGANGQAAQSAKMMNWMMPVMFGVFSFMYTASFSLYLIVSTLYSMLSTVIINKIVEKNFQKNLKKEEDAEYQKRYGYLTKNKEDK